jgi:membrane-associated progesterone receptor component
MRQMQAYKWQEGWVRFCNMARPNFTFTGMTLQDLGHYDGDNNRPTYFASDGWVWDVSDSEMFRESYALWKGKEASVALAKMSLDRKDVNRTDWDTLNDSELASLRSWTTYFREKYRIVGRLQGFSVSKK